MNIKDLVLTNRSYRRFYEDQTVDAQTLRELIDLARLSPSGANMQPLKYILSCVPEKNNRIFPTLKWAGYLHDWPGPEAGERPAAYLVVLNDTTLSKTAGCDHGIAAQSILLGAAEKGLGGCIIASIQRAELAQALNIPAQYEILLVLALGKPKEEVQIDSIGPDGSIKYWRDGNQVHHVPKRAIEEIVLDL
jgi:nitroreductase